jgi:hypothetical protein
MRKNFTQLISKGLAKAEADRKAKEQQKHELDKQNKDTKAEQ